MILIAEFLLLIAALFCITKICLFLCCHTVYNFAAYRLILALDNQSLEKKFEAQIPLVFTDVMDEKKFEGCCVF